MKEIKEKILEERKNLYLKLGLKYVKGSEQDSCIDAESEIEDLREYNCLITNVNRLEYFYDTIKENFENIDQKCKILLTRDSVVANEKNYYIKYVINEMDAIITKTNNCILKLPEFNE